MNLNQTFLFILAHPDDESVLTGGTLYSIAKAGGTAHLAVLTRGEKGFKHLEEDFETDDLSTVRAKELANAARFLGIKHIHTYDFPDGGLADIPESDLVHEIQQLIQTINPDAIVSFGPNPDYPHNDHITTRKVSLRAIGELHERNKWSGPVFLQIIPEENVQTLNEMRLERKSTEGIYGVDDQLPTEGRINVDISDEAFRAKLNAVGAHTSQHPENFIEWLKKFPTRDEVYIRKYY